MSVNSNSTPAAVDIEVPRNFNGETALDQGARPAVPTGNGRLSREIFETAGIPVTWTPRAKDGLAPHQPILSKAEILRQGQEALVQLSRGHDWASWKKVLAVLDIARGVAMWESGTNAPQGRRYSKAFGNWFQRHPEFAALVKLDGGTRARFFECFAQLAAIDDWRAGLPVEQRLKLNYPVTVLAHFKKRYGPTRRAGGFPRAKPLKAPEHKLTVLLRTMSDAEVTKQLPVSLPFERFLQTLSADWRAELESRLQPKAAFGHLSTMQLVDLLEQQLKRDGINATAALQKLRKLVDRPKVIDLKAAAVTAA